MKISYSPIAETDLIDIADYFIDRNANALERIEFDIKNTINSLTSFPKMGKKVSRRDVRKIITPRYRYVIFYRVDTLAGRLIILTILHPSRDRSSFEI